MTINNLNRFLFFMKSNEVTPSLISRVYKFFHKYDSLLRGKWLTRGRVNLQVNHIAYRGSMLTLNILGYPRTAVSRFTFKFIGGIF